jgi:hypothetical protein
MSNAPSDTPGSFRRKPVRTSLKVVANAARAALGLAGLTPERVATEPHTRLR